jgi:DNA-binding protein Fis
VKIASVIAKLEKQQRDLGEIVTALREISDLGWERLSDLSWDEHEKRLLLEALQDAGGNQTEAARILKISRDKIRYKLVKHGLGGKRAAPSSSGT